MSDMGCVQGCTVTWIVPLPVLTGSLVPFVAWIVALIVDPASLCGRYATGRCISARAAVCFGGSSWPWGSALAATSVSATGCEVRVCVAMRRSFGRADVSADRYQYVACEFAGLGRWECRMCAVGHGCITASSAWMPSASWRAELSEAVTCVEAWHPSSAGSRLSGLPPR